MLRRLLEASARAAGQPHSSSLPTATLAPVLLPSQAAANLTAPRPPQNSPGMAPSLPHHNPDSTSPTLSSSAPHQQHNSSLYLQPAQSENDSFEYSILAAFSDMETVFLACISTLLPLIVALGIAFGIRHVWRKYKDRRTSTSSGLPWYRGVCSRDNTCESLRHSQINIQPQTRQILSAQDVLLLEAGAEEPLAAEVPQLMLHLHNTSLDYAYQIKDILYDTYPRGKAMGGSTTINGMLYCRGSKADYDDWANSGNEGWGWKDVLPYFKKSENARDPEILAKYAEYHGTGGYLTVERYPTEPKNVQTFMNAFIEVGFNETDYNKGDQIGVARLQFTNVHGVRLSANGAFIRPFRGKRSNLIVRPNTHVNRIIIDPKTKRATGVEYEIINENRTVTKQAFAKKEVIVSAGFVESPKLLMLSGIGPKKHLEQLNITVIEDLPVGLNLRDHRGVSLSLISNNSVSRASDEQIKGDLFQWINTHEGPQSRSTDIDIIAFHQTKFENRSGAADIQYEIWNNGIQNDGTIGNVSIVTVLVAPKSSGSIKLNSVDPINNQPDITLNFLADPRDVEVMVEGLKFSRHIGSTQTLKEAGLKFSTIPTTGCEDIDIDSDDYLRCHIKKTVSQYYHGVGTCKMGPNTDVNAVVDPTLKVRGIHGLRVIDASIMPQVIRANTMAPTIMIGEKGSDMIKKDYL